MTPRIDFNLFPRRNPTLPQNATARGKKKRAAQLLQSQQQYQWTLTLENVEDVPMATAVPGADKPSLPWLLLLSEVGLKLAENFVAVKLHGASLAGSETNRTQRVLDDVRGQLSSIRELKVRPTGNSDADWLEKIVLPANQLLGTHNMSFEGLLAQFKALEAQFDLEQSTGDSLGEYEALFDTLALPAIAHNFMDDESFARFRVAGPNPMLLKGINTLPAKLPLSEAQYQAVMGAGDSLAEAFAERRLYLLDYAELNYLAAVPGEIEGLEKFVFAPIALFAIPKGGRSIVPVTIQCGQDPAGNPLFFPTTTQGPKIYGWQMAKTVVQVAECNYHELFVHLARTHLVMEAFAVATHRCLAEVHPVNILLVPHCMGTLFINNAAARFLISEGSPIDRFFGAPIERSQQAAGDDRLNFDFYANMLPTDLKNRAVDNPSYLPDYPYRDDALLLWAAIETWVNNYVQLYYTDDASVLADGELAAWCTSLTEDGKVKGFKKITDRDQLVSVLTMIIHIASAQHAAVNFPQQPLMTYAPAICGAGWSKAPTKQSGGSEKSWVAMLPPIEFAFEQLNVLYLLGSFQFRVLGDYRSNNFPYLEWFEDPAVKQSGGPLAQFQNALKGIEAKINARNTLRIGYQFLLPSKIPNSINI